MLLLMRLLIYWTPVKVDMVCAVAVFSFFPLSEHSPQLDEHSDALTWPHNSGQEWNPATAGIIINETPRQRVITSCYLACQDGLECPAACQCLFVGVAFEDLPPPLD